ncbi:MAG: hypothetical protein WD066_07255 [Planctomycetaceae bacterium]
MALLPSASSGDVYFDIEGFPLAEDGLEYLFGVVTVENGVARFQDWWAHDRNQPPHQNLWVNFGSGRAALLW